MRTSNDEIHEFHERLKHARDLAIKKLDTGVDSDVLEYIKKDFVKDILVVYLLCDARLITIAGNVVIGSELFSDSCFNNGNLLGNFLALVAGLEGDGPFDFDCNGHDVHCSRVNVPLVNSSFKAISALDRGAIDQASGRGIFAVINEFHWCIDEFSREDTAAEKIMTPAILADIFAHDEPGHSRKKKGMYYTPRDIARYICKAVLHAHLFGEQATDAIDPLDAITRDDPEFLQRTLDTVNALKALDPACGTGEFMLVLANELLLIKKRLLALLGADAITQDNALRSEILVQNIHGTDLMDEAIQIARKRSWLWVLASFKGKTIEDGDAIQIADVSRNIRAGNALIGWLDEDMENPGNVQAVTDNLSTILHREHGIAAFADRTLLERMRPIHWRLEFPGGFDIVVGNPPYVFTRGMSFSDVEMACYKTWYLKGYNTRVRGKARQAGKMNAFGLFIVRSMNLLKDHGMLGFIVPNTILRTTTNDTLRQFMLEASRIKEIVDLQDGVFSGVTASTVITILEKKSVHEAPGIVRVKHAVIDLLGGKYQYHDIEQARFLDNPACSFDIHVTGEFAAIFNFMKENSFELGEITSEIIEGLVTRRGDALFTTDATNPLARKMLRGKDIDRYAIHWRPGQYIIYDPELLHRARPLRVHEAPVKLIAQRIGGGTYPLRVAYDDKQFYVFASINAVLLKDTPIIEQIAYNYKYVLACLNSLLLNVYYLLTFSNKSTLTVNVSKTYLEMLPIKKASLQVQEAVANLVDYILFLQEKFSTEKDLINFFDQDLLDGVIFEQYLFQYEEPCLIDVVNQHVHNINGFGGNDDDIFIHIVETASCLKDDEGFKKARSVLNENPIWRLIRGLLKERLRGKAN